MFQLTRSKRYLFSILSGLLMVVSFPFTGSLAPLMLFAWIPLLLVENNIFHNKYRSSKVFIHSYLTFLIYNVGTTWWIWNASPEGAIFAFVLNALIMALVFQAFHITKKYLGKREGDIAFIIYWVGFEHIHYYWELSWPWLNLGNTFASAPSLVQWYCFSGVLGGSCWILICNLLGYHVLKNVLFKKETWIKQKKLIISLTALIFLPMIFSLIQYYTYTEMGKATEVVVTQPNVDPYYEKFTGSVSQQLNRICDLADQQVTDSTMFVLAPETAVPLSMYNEDEIERIIYFSELIQRKAKWKNASLLIGASTKKYFKDVHSRASKKINGGPGYEEFYNSSLLINEYDRPKFVHKSKLVLGVEKVPFSNVFPFLEDLSINNGGTSGTLGVEDESQVLISKGIKFAPVVCYESIYGEFISDQCKKGAELIFIITNDGWWKDTPGYKQHNAFARLRAIENRKSIARSANTGTSCFINQRGDVSKSTGWWVEGSIKETLYRNDHKTFFVKYGNILGGALAYTGLFLALYTLYKLIRKKISR